MQYTDIWANDNYLQFMYERLVLLKELMSDKGTIYLHCDWHKSHHLRFLLDEIFGLDFFINEILWRRTYAGKTIGRALPANTDTILVYSKTKDYIFSPPFKDLTDKDREMFTKDDEDGRGLYGTVSLQKVSGPTPGTAYDYTDNAGKIWKCPAKGWRMVKEKLKALENDNRLYVNGNTIREKYYLIEREEIGKQVDNAWFDIGNMNRAKKQDLNYPTQKPEALLERIVQISSISDSIILDCFCGSGTTQAVAQKLGRRWIGADINKGAIQTTSKRLQAIIGEQRKKLTKDSEHLAFAHYRINDYDMQIQHNEMRELVTQHLGIQKTKTYSYFDGLLGTELVKIIPLNHPLSLMDLQLTRDELDKRKDETRNVVLVSLGKELSVDDELAIYNKSHPVNKIRTIELKTDKKYGAFFVHSPAQAKVKITKSPPAKGEKKGVVKATVVIEDFISPSIVNRLNIDATLFTAQIKDFRSQIDVVLIDTNYDGKVFNIIVSDVPEKKADLVSANYKFDLPRANASVAVKIIDMLGEEVLIVE